MKLAATLTLLLFGLAFSITPPSPEAVAPNNEDIGFSFTTASAADTSSPTHSFIEISSTVAGQPIKFSVKWTDNIGLSKFCFGTNNTGTWVNDTWTGISGTSAWANVTKTLTSSVGVRVEFRWWCNDTSNNINDTGIQFIVTTSSDTVKPTCSNVGINTTLAAQTVKFSVLLQDNVGLSRYRFGTNNSGAWVNDTWTGISGTSAWANVTKTLNAAVGVRVEFRWWFNDTSNNFNDTGIRFIITTSPAPSTASLTLRIRDAGGGILASKAYITMNNGSSYKKQVDLSGQVMFTSISSGATVKITAQHLNSTNSNGWVKVNETNSISWKVYTNDNKTLRLSYYGGLKLIFKANDGSIITPTQVTLYPSSNYTVRNLTSFSGLHFANGSIILSQITFQGANVRKNVTDSFNVTASGQGFSFNVRYFMLSFTFTTDNNTPETPSNMTLTAGNGTTITLTSYSREYFTNGTISPSTIYKYNVNVRKNITDSFSPTGDQSFHHNVKIYTITFLFKTAYGDPTAVTSMTIRACNGTQISFGEASSSNLHFPNGTITPVSIYKYGVNVRKNLTDTITPTTSKGYLYNIKIYLRSFLASSFKTNDGATLNTAPSGFTLTLANTSSARMSVGKIYILTNGTHTWKDITWRAIQISPFTTFDPEDGNATVNTRVYRDSKPNFQFALNYTTLSNIGFSTGVSYDNLTLKATHSGNHTLVVEILTGYGDISLYKLNTTQYNSTWLWNATDKTIRIGIRFTTYTITLAWPGTGPLPIAAPKTTTHPIQWEGKTYIVSIRSNSSISNFNFSQPMKQISYVVEGGDGTKGFCNITIPKELMSGTFTILVDERPVPPKLAGNDTHTSLYFTYQHTSHALRVVSTHVIPEFPLPIIILTVTLAATAFLPRIVKKTWEAVERLNEYPRAQILLCKTLLRCICYEAARFRLGKAIQERILTERLAEESLLFHL